jgi:phosphatidylserine synthase
MLTKVLVEHESAGGSARLHFLAAASFALMAILRLVRYNLEPASHAEREPAGADEVKTFQGLPSPAAAGAVAATLWLYLILRRPELEVEEGTPTWMHRMLAFMREVDWTPFLDWIPTLLVGLLPVLGFLMVSNLRYVHGISFITSRGGQFLTLVSIVFSLILFYLAPVPILFLSAMGFVLSGILAAPIVWLRERSAQRTA